MTSELLFVTSSQVTPELVLELQKADPDSPVPSAYTPALHTHQPRTSPEPRNAEPNTIFDLFEGYTDDQLRAIAEERGKTDKKVYPETFLILDDKGVETKTVVVHHLGPIFTEDGYDIEGHRWFVWRLRFEDVYNMLAVMSTKTGPFVEVYSKPEGFVDEEGIYRVKDHERALKYRL